MLTLALALASQVAHGCSYLPTIWGFDDRIDGAVDVPTDARLFVDANFTQIGIEVVPVGGGAAVAGTLSWPASREDDTEWQVWTPAAPLAPSTTYVATVEALAYQDIVVTTGEQSVTFTTGAAPAVAPAAPVITAVTFGPWYGVPTTGSGCVSPHDERSVAVEIELDAVEPLSWLELRDGDQPRLQLREPLTAGGPITLPLDWTQWTLTSPVGSPGYDCLVPVLVTPSGLEVHGVELCGIPVVDTGDTGTGGTGAPTQTSTPSVGDTGPGGTAGPAAGDTGAPVAGAGSDPEGGAATGGGCGCATGGGPGGWIVLLAALVLALTRPRGRTGR